jgi:hypothetical protein
MPMRSKRAILIACASLLFVPAAVLAHHALQAQFDMNQTITLTGAVTKMDWSNPHVRLYLEVKDGDLGVVHGQPEPATDERLED